MHILLGCWLQGGGGSVILKYKAAIEKKSKQDLQTAQLELINLYLLYACTHIYVHICMGCVYAYRCVWVW